MVGGAWSCAFPVVPGLQQCSLQLSSLRLSAVAYRIPAQPQRAAATVVFTSWCLARSVQYVMAFSETAERIRQSPPQPFVLMLPKPKGECVNCILKLKPKQSLIHSEGCSVNKLTCEGCGWYSSISIRFTFQMHFKLLNRSS